MIIYGGLLLTVYLFFQEETEIIDRLWELEQSNVISFNDMEYDVAAKVMHFASFKYCFICRYLLYGV